MEDILLTTYLYPQAVVGNGTTTGNSWTNPNNILAVDDDTADSNNSQSSDITVGNFNFDIPQDAVVTGIAFKVRGYAAAITSPLTTLTFYAVDNTSGEDVFYPYESVFSGLTTDMDWYEFGGQTYLFATEFTPTQINNLKLQLIANNAVFIDAVVMQVAYYIPTVTTPETVVPEETPGYESPLQAGPFRLSRPLGATDTKMYLETFTYPNGSLIQLTDIVGGYLQMTIDPSVQSEGSGTPFEENVQTASWSQIATGEIEIDFGSLTNRGLDYKYGFTSVSDNINDHAKGAQVILSTNGPFLNKLVKKTEQDTVFSAPIEIDYEDVEITPAVHRINFTGTGAQVSEITDNEVQVNIPGVGGASQPQRYSAASSSSGSTQVSSLTYSIEIGGTNRAAIVQISTQEDITVDSVEVGGVPCVQEEVSTDVTGNIRSEIWSCIAPPVGTQDIVIGLSGVAYISSGAEIFVSVDQSTPTGSTQTATGNNTNPSLSLTTTLDYSVVIDSLSTALTPILYTPGSTSQVENWSETSNSNTRQGGSTYQFAGSSPDDVVMSYSLTQSTRWAYTAVELKGIVVTPVLTGLTVKENGVTIESDVSEIDFTGSNVSVTNTAPNKVEVQVEANLSTPVVREYSSPAKSVPSSFTAGYSETTRFDITNPAGTTFRYTYDGTGTDPNINSGTVSVNQSVQIYSPNFSSGNNGSFLVTGVGTNYFEVTNASGVAENDKVLAAGVMSFFNSWTKPANLSYIVYKVQGPGGGSGGINVAADAAGAGAGSGGYSYGILAASALNSVEITTPGMFGLGGASGSNGTAGRPSIFKGVTANSGSASTAPTAGTGSTGASGGSATGGDVNITGQLGSSNIIANGNVVKGGDGGRPSMEGGYGGFGQSETVNAGNGSRGGGAAGSYVNGAGTTSGYNGGRGVIQIWEYYNNVS